MGRISWGSEKRSFGAWSSGPAEERTPPIVSLGFDVFSGTLGSIAIRSSLTTTQYLVRGTAVSVAT